MTSDRDALLHQSGRPLLVDYFCCQGGAGMGYHRAGFDVVGVDLMPQPQYPFPFVRGDALEVMQRVIDNGNRWFDGRPVVASHASPPCQGYLNLGQVNRTMGRPYEYPELIGDTREFLAQTDGVWVIENVADARKAMHNPVRVCGTSFGLPLRRHRLFESNVPILGTACAHHLFTEKRYWTGWRPKGEHRLSTVVQVYGNAADKHEWPAAMGIGWMTNDGMAEAVPPAYAEHIGVQLLAALEMHPRWKRAA